MSFRGFPKLTIAFIAVFSSAASSNHEQYADDVAAAATLAGAEAGQGMWEGNTNSIFKSLAIHRATILQVLTAS
jgi:hypothetical protein